MIMMASTSHHYHC